MDKHLVTDLKVDIKGSELLRVLRLPDDPACDDSSVAIGMLREALGCARPKFVCCVASIDRKMDDGVVVEGRLFRSALASQKLAEVHRIVPYVATCGLEVDAWSGRFTDMLERFWADEIKKLLLVKCVDKLRAMVKKRYFPASDMSSMNPGSLPEWPITEQPVLFDVIGDVEKDIGVRLTDSCLMIPSKSVSGFFFSSKAHHENCMLCPRADCPGRRAPYARLDS